MTRRWQSPNNRRSTSGGWVAGTLDTHDGLCRQLAHDLALAMVSVQVDAAPGHKPLQCCEDALLALQTLGEGRAKPGVNTERLIVGGDGSGAHMGLQAAWRLARLKPGSVDSVLAFYPLVKPDFNTVSYQRFAGSPVFTRDDAVRAWNVLLQGNRELWDERAVLSHGSATPVPNPPAVVCWPPSRTRRMTTRSTCTTGCAPWARAASSSARPECRMTLRGCSMRVSQRAS